MANATRITLLERVQATDAGGPWREFVAVYDSLIYAWLSSQGFTGPDLDDLRQEVMQTVVAEIGNFDHNGRQGAFRNWLRRITSNRMRRYWGQRRRHFADYAGPDAEALAKQLDDNSSRLTIAWDAQHDRFVLNRLLGMLQGRFTVRSLAAFRRLAIEQESAATVAADLGMTIGAARVAQHRVLRALKELGRGMVDA